VSLLNQGVVSGTSFRDGPAAIDGSSSKVQIVDRKTELILESHEMSNSSIMRASLLRTLEPVRQARGFLTISG